MSTPKLDNQKGSFYSETSYRMLPEHIKCIWIIRFRNVSTEEITNDKYFTSDHDVARLLLNLGHFIY